MKKKFILPLVLVLFLIFVVGCSGNPEPTITNQVANQSPTLFDELNALKTITADTTSKVTKLNSIVVSLPGFYTYTSTKAGLQIGIPPGTGKVVFKITLVPQSPILAGNPNDSYDVALKSFYSSNQVVVGYAYSGDDIAWNPIKSQWQVQDIFFYTGSVTLNSSPQKMDVAYTVLTPCVALVSVLNGVNP